MTYRLARNHHNPMEPHATIARWDGDRLTVGQDPVGHRRHPDGTRRRVRDPVGIGAGHLTVRRRCFRQWSADLAARHRRGLGGPRDRPSGQGRTEPQAAVLRDGFPARVRVSSAPGQRPQRARERHDPRHTVRDLDLRAVRRGRDPPGGAASLQHAQREPDVPDRAPRREHPGSHARPGLRHRLVRHRVGDGRTLLRARHRPDRAAAAQRTGDRPGERQLVLHPQAARVLHHRHPGVRLGPAQPEAPFDPRRRLADRHRHGDRRLPHPAGPGPGPDPPGRRRHCPGRVRDQRHGPRYLHLHEPGRRRRPRPADAQGHLPARRLLMPNAPLHGGS